MHFSYLNTKKKKDLLIIRSFLRVLIFILILYSSISKSDSKIILNNDRSEYTTTNNTNSNPTANNTNPNPTANNTNPNPTANNTNPNSTANNTNPNPAGNNTNSNSTRNNGRDRFSENDYNRNLETETNRRFDHTEEYDYDDIYSTSVDSNDTDSLSVDKHDENRLPNNTIINQTSLKNYDAENFEESSSTDQFFLPNRIVNQSDLIEKIRNFRFLLSLADDSNLTCYIEVNRINLLDDSKGKVLSRTPSDLKGKIRVTFEDEHGYDVGGLRKEWFNLVIKEALNLESVYFCYSQDDTSTIRPSNVSKIDPDYKLYYKFVGRVLGMAIIQDCKVTTNFDKTVYKYLLNKEFKFSDLQDLDPDLFRSLNYYFSINVDDEDLYFIHEYEEYGELKVKELVYNGSNILVTEKNKKSYLKLKTEMVLYNFVKDQLNAMKEGFYDIIEPNLLNDFTESEFEILLCGISEIDIDDWKRNTEYRIYDSNSQAIRWFWEAVDKFTLDQRKKILQFVTGSDKVPFGGFANLGSNGTIYRFTISKSYKSDAHLPDAHTCFNKLDLPDYSTYEILEEKLLTAISEGSEGITEF